MPRSRRRPPEARIDRVHRSVGVYAGGGASHSWIWAVDTLERQGFTGIRVLDHHDLAAAVPFGEALIVGGGDPYAMAADLGPLGARRLRRYVEDGGHYFGFCAGAYLVARVDPPELHRFRLTETGIGNVVDVLPLIRTLPTKAATVYGDRWVLHPARERVRLEMQAAFGLQGPLEAPLYGGAPLLPGPSERVLARYASFCPDTLFLVDPQVAEDMFLGRAAAVEGTVGAGKVFLFGPHLEAPGYPEANRLFAELVCGAGAGRAGRGPGASAPSDEVALFPASDVELRRHVGDARIAANAMVLHEVSWKLGEKFYEPAKIPVFLEAVWSRLLYRTPLLWPEAGWERAVADAERIVELVRETGRRIREDRDSSEQAAELFPRLRRFTAGFLNAYFAGRRLGQNAEVRAGRRCSV